MPAFPSSMYIGMTLHDWFASSMPTDEVQDLAYRTLSRLAQEKIANAKHPIEPPSGASSDVLVDYQIAKIDFYCRVNAAIRYKMANAMIEKRYSNGS